MKLNQELIKRLRADEIQIHNNGTTEQLNAISQELYRRNVCDHSLEYYVYGKYHLYGKWVKMDKPIYTVDSFFGELKYETKQTDAKKPMDSETRELAKQLFVHAGMDGISAIRHAKEFIKKINEISATDKD